MNISSDQFIQTWKMNSPYTLRAKFYYEIRQIGNTNEKDWFEYTHFLIRNKFIRNPELGTLKSYETRGLES